MGKTIRIRTEQENNLTKVKVLIKHPMETGLRKNAKTGEIIPAHFIREVACKLNDITVVDATWGVAISKDPYLSFTLEGTKKGDVISVAWLDNKNQSDADTKILT